MADAKLTALSAIGSIAASDIFYLVDDPGGSPISNKATFTQLLTFLGTDLTTLANLNSIQGVSFTFGAYAATVLNNANEAAFKTAVNLEAGVDYQAYDATLAAFAAYNTAGILTQTAADTFTGRTITGTAAEITATNGDGVAGNPTLSLPTALTFTGKTVTGGTFASVTHSGTTSLASGHVFNWDSSDVTLTHSANTLTISGGSVTLGTALAEGSGGTGSTAFATATEVRTGTAAKVIAVDDFWSAQAEVTITYAASVAPDFATFFDAVITLTDNLTLANGTNLKVGQKGRFRLVQDATGSRTLSTGTDFETTSGAAIVLSTAANAQDVIYYDIIAAGRVLLSVGGRAIS